MVRSSPRRAASTTSLLALVAVVACGGPSPATGPTASAVPTPRPTPTAVPTPIVTPGPSPTEGAIELPELIVRVTTCTEICEPSPGTTVLADGRLIWPGPDGRPLAARLTPAALQRVRDEVAAHHELATDGDYQARLRPGAEPFPRGTTVYRFEVGPGDPRIVTSGEPRDFEIEPNLWVIPPEMERLATLAGALLEPLAWLGPDALAERARPYRPDRYLVLVELFPDIGATPGLDVELDDVASPFGLPLHAVGDLLSAPGDPFAVRCAVTDGDTARRLAAAERDVGVRRDPDAWSSAIGYAWSVRDGFAQLTLTHVLPHESDPCAEIELR